MSVTLDIIHIKLQGQPGQDVQFSELDIGRLSSDTDILEAISAYTSVSVDTLRSNYVVRREDSEGRRLTLSPNTTLG
ncbi:MAG: hypothetical protein GY861_21365 [bacterium]|nr:hypothetical protein [bacterium]